MLSFVEIAKESGIVDTASFAPCISQPGAVPSIERDIAAAKALNISGTPTITVNGWLLRETADSAAVSRVIDQELRKDAQDRARTSSPK